MLHNGSMKCPKCKSTQISKNGHHHGKQNYICKQCRRQFVEFYEALLHKEYEIGDKIHRLVEVPTLVTGYENETQTILSRSQLERV